MAFKKLTILFLMLIIGMPFVKAQNQPLNPDSVLQQVFRALTAEQIYVDKNLDQYFYGIEWEALAYWDTEDPKQIINMHEAVGDIYQFTKTSFAIKAIDPENTRNYLPTLTGRCQLSNNTLTLTAASGNTLVLKVILLDANYLIFEMDGLRIFFTKSR